VVLELGVNRDLAVWRFLEEKMFQFPKTKFIRITANNKLLWRPDDIVDNLNPERYCHVLCPTKDFLGHINTMHEKEGRKDLEIDFEKEAIET
jgi:hypothetical protein